MPEDLNVDRTIITQECRTGFHALCMVELVTDDAATPNFECPCLCHEIGTPDQQPTEEQPEE